MELKVIRKEFTETSTIGELYTNGKFFCYTLEDKVRPEGTKIYGKTAIPAGTYQVVIEYSPKFSREMPHILDVPNFTGILIHPGNTSVDTEGCLLVGYKKGPDTIYESRHAFDDFFTLLKQDLQTGNVYINIA